MRLLLISSLLFTGPLLTACISSASDDGSGGNGGSATGGTGGVGGAAGGATSCYEGAPNQGDEASDWSMPNEEDTFTLTAPDEPGGGLFRLQVTASHPDVIPSVNVLNTEFLQGAAALSGSAATTANEQEWNGAFVAWPGKSYEVQISDFFSAPTAAYPVSYTYTWSYEPLVDCYEPNDTLADAALIPRGQDIEAYMVAGYETDAYGSLLDHYAVDVEEPGDLTFTLISQPGTTLTIRAFRPDSSFDEGYAQLDSTIDLAPGESHTVQATDPGRYVFEVRDSGLSMIANQDDPLPEHLSDTYKFRVD